MNDSDKVDSDINQELNQIKAQKSISLDEILSNINKLPSFTGPQVEKLLTTLPYRMEDIEKKIVIAEARKDSAEISLKRLEALYKLKSIEKKQSKELTSEGDRTSWVLTQPEIQEAQDLVLQTRKELADLQVIFNRYERNFTAVRKIASMMTNVDVNMGISQKYTR